MVTGWFRRVTRDSCVGVWCCRLTHSLRTGKHREKDQSSPMAVRGSQTGVSPFIMISPDTKNPQGHSVTVKGWDGHKSTLYSRLNASPNPNNVWGTKVTQCPPHWLVCVINSSFFTNYSFSSVPLLQLPSKHSQRRIRFTFSLPVTGTKPNLVWLGASNGTYYWAQYVCYYLLN